MSVLLKEFVFRPIEGKIVMYFDVKIIFHCYHFGRKLDWTSLLTVQSTSKLEFESVWGNSAKLNLFVIFRVCPGRIVMRLGAKEFT